MPSLRSLTGTLLALCLLALALYWTQQQWRYQRALAAGDPALATQIWPANAAGWRALADKIMFSDLNGATAAARHAVADDRDDWRNWAHLALVQVEAGDLAAARQSTAHMVTHTQGFDGHWMSANLQLATGDSVGFWREAAVALRLAPAGEVASALPTLWLAASGNTAQFDAALRAAAPRNPAIAPATLGFLLDQGHTAAADSWWQLGLRGAHPGGLTATGNQYLTALLQANEPAAALAVWRQGRARGVFAAADGPSSGNLIAPGVAGPLGWWLCTSCGPWMSLQSGKLTLQFQGSQADALTLARQTLLLAPNTAYRLRFRAAYQPPPLVAAPAATGVTVAILGPGDKPLVAGARGPLLFTTPATPAAWRLQISYQRPLGDMPLNGTVTLSGFSLHP